MPSLQRTDFVIIAVILAIGSLLLFPNLGDRDLWQDEAETALLAGTVLEYGIPKAWDGHHRITDQSDSRQYNDDDVWTWSGWLQFYVCAAAQSVLKPSPFRERILFAIAGLLTLPLLYIIAWRFTRDRFFAAVCVGILMGSVFYLLLMRQCRHYSFDALLTLCMVLFYHQYARGRRGIVGFTIAAILMFHAFFVTFFANMIAITVLFILYQRRPDRRRQFFISLAVIASCTLPFFIYSEGWSRDYSGLGNGFDSPWRFLSLLKTYLLLIVHYLFPLVVLAAAEIAAATRAPRYPFRRVVLVLAALMLSVYGLCINNAHANLMIFAYVLGVYLVLGVSILVRAHRAHRRSMEFPWQLFIGSMLVVNVVVLSLVSPLPFFRYLSGIYPLMVLLLTYWAYSRAFPSDPVAAGEGQSHDGMAERTLSTRNKVLVLAVILAMITSNFMYFAPSRLMIATGLITPAIPYDFSITVDGSDVTPPSMGFWADTTIDGVILWRVLTRPMKSDLLAYLGELTEDAVGDPNRIIVDYLNRHAAATDTIFAQYAHYTLMYRTPFKVFAPVEFEDAPAPDWIVRRQFHSYTQNPKALAQRMNESEYELIRLPGTTDLPWGLSRPDPTYHIFKVVPIDDLEIEIERKVQPDDDR